MFEDTSASEQAAPRCVCIPTPLSGRSWHVDRPPPFAFVTPDQQVQAFGKSLAPKHAHPHPFNLRVDDIPGAKPKEHCFATSPRLTNPLEPQYQLPNSGYVQPGPPVQRFIRNAIDNSDIPGAQVVYLRSSASCCEHQIIVLLVICTARMGNNTVCHKPHIAQLRAVCCTKCNSRNFTMCCRQLQGANPGVTCIISVWTALTWRALLLAGSLTGK